MVPQRGGRSVTLNPEACEFIPSVQEAGPTSASGSRSRKGPATPSTGQVNSSDGCSRWPAGRRDSVHGRKGSVDIVHHDTSFRGLLPRGGDDGGAVVPARQRPRKKDNGNSSGSIPSEPKSINSRERPREHGSDGREAMVRGAIWGPADVFEAGSSRGASRRRGGRRRTSRCVVHTTRHSSYGTPTVGVHVIHVAAAEGYGKVAVITPRPRERPFSYASS